MPGIWLPITDYSSKYKISVSTLRRRIKTDDIKYRFLEGKYLLLDEPVTTHSLHRPSRSDSFANESGTTVSGQNPASEVAQSASEAGFVQSQPYSPPVMSAPQPSPLASTKPFAPSTDVNLDGPILSAANRLLTELKKAYSQILQEKEEQILQLREEVTDLKTLVRVLEGENDKLNERVGSSYRSMDL